VAVGAGGGTGRAVAVAAGGDTGRTVAAGASWLERGVGEAGGAVVGAAGAGPTVEIGLSDCPTLAVVVEKNLKTLIWANVVAKTEAPTNAPRRKTKPTAERIARR
jgi:hypothetical protein